MKSEKQLTIMAYKFGSLSLEVFASVSFIPLEFPQYTIIK
jgi:hypothetical protein